MEGGVKPIIVIVKKTRNYLKGESHEIGEAC
jgi:hypothetical protein